jgi:hypothetical protein
MHITNHLLSNGIVSRKGKTRKGKMVHIFDAIWKNNRLKGHACHPEKAKWPIVVTLLEITIDARDMHP